MKEPSMWELACADVAELYDRNTCDYKAPDVVHGSYIISDIIGAYGVFVSIEWRIYLAPDWFIASGGLTRDEVLYHESIHAVLYGSQLLPEDSRCTSELIARELSDKRFGTESATNGWEVWYGCVDPSEMI
jgi:hypothetical protein